MPVAAVMGGSAGLGYSIAAALLESGYDVVIIGRDAERLEQARQSLEELAAKARPTERRGAAGKVLAVRGAMDRAAEVARAFEAIAEAFGRLDVLVNNIGISDRGSMENLTPERLLEVCRANLLPSLLCSQAALPMLIGTQGVIINVGSLAGKVGAPYLGAYPAAKHALAGMTQQMRLEWKQRGVHVGMINPGPIRRQDAGSRYATRIAGDGSLPEHAAAPGGGARVGGLAAERVAACVVRTAQRRRVDVMLPGYLRPLVAIGHLWPALGDWLLLRFTSAKRS